MKDRLLPEHHATTTNNMLYKTSRIFKPIYVLFLSRTILVVGFLFVIWQSYISE